MKKWTVRVIEGWMQGFHKFTTKKAALAFWDEWIRVAINGGDMKAHEKLEWLGKQ